MIEKFDPKKEYAIGQEVEIDGHECTVEEDTHWCGTDSAYCIKVDNPQECTDIKCSRNRRISGDSVCFIAKDKK